MMVTVRTSTSTMPLIVPKVKRAQATDPLLTLTTSSEGWVSD